MTATYRAAIIGTGRIGATYDDEVTPRHKASFWHGPNRHAGLYTILPVNHAAAYQSSPGFELVAAANRGSEKLRSFGERYAVPALYTDFRAMLAQERPDVVSVCTQSPDKAEVTIAAAEAGVKAIVVEKAMATSLAEADAMIAACERNGVLLVVNHPFRFSPLLRRAKELLDGGAIGSLGTVSGISGGGMLHVGTHTFDALRFFAGDVTEIWAEVPNYRPESDIPATASLRFANGTAGFVDHVHRVQSGFELRGTAGSISVSTHVGDGWLSRLSPFAPDSTRAYPSRLETEPIEADHAGMSTTQRILAELHATLSDGAPFISTGHDGRAALELGIACYQSHLAGEPVRLPLADRSLRVPNR
jgi:predicted dehydrogenase